MAFRDGQELLYVPGRYLITNGTDASREHIQCQPDTRPVCETHSCPHPGTIVNKGLINKFHNMLKMGIYVKYVYHIKNWNSAE